MDRKEKRVLEACNAISRFFFVRISARTTEGHSILVFHTHPSTQIDLCTSQTTVHVVAVRLFAHVTVENRFEKDRRRRKRKNPPPPPHRSLGKIFSSVVEILHSVQDRCLSSQQCRTEILSIFDRRISERMPSTMKVCLTE